LLFFSLLIDSHLRDLVLAFTRLSLFSGKKHQKTTVWRIPNDGLKITDRKFVKQQTRLVRRDCGHIVSLVLREFAYHKKSHRSSFYFDCRQRPRTHLLKRKSPTNTLYTFKYILSIKSLTLAYFFSGFLSKPPHGTPEDFSTAIDGSCADLKPKSLQDLGCLGSQVTAK